jgi:uncharacterized protein YdeI (BOF family)
MKWTSAIVLLCSVAAGCGERSPKTLGAEISGLPTSVANVRQASNEATVVVSGAMDQKCPVAGCWFVLKDGSGTIKVDTKNAGFVVLDVPLHSTVVASGRVRTNGTDVYIDATGVRY